MAHRFTDVGKFYWFLVLALGIVIVSWIVATQVLLDKPSPAIHTSNPALLDSKLKGRGATAMGTSKNEFQGVLGGERMDVRHSFASNQLDMQDSGVANQLLMINRDTLAHALEIQVALRQALPNRVESLHDNVSEVEERSVLEVGKDEVRSFIQKHSQLDQLVSISQMESDLGDLAEEGESTLTIEVRQSPETRQYINEIKSRLPIVVITEEKP